MDHRAVTAFELIDEDGKDTSTLRRVDDDRGCRRQVGDALCEVECELRLMPLR